MTLKECYQILDLNQLASLEEVKRVYRRRAFELHPDLNPGIADASRQFQRLNEAYVILSKLIAVREERENKKKNAAGSAQAKRESAQTARPGQEHAASATSGSASGTDADAAQHAQRAGQDSQNTAAGQQTTQDNPNRDTSANHGATGSSSETTENGATSRSAASSTASSATSSATSSAASPEQEASEGHKHGPRDSVYTEQQEVLQDILRDPFARRVFEDIYSAIRKKAPSAPPPPAPSVPPSLKRKLPSRLSGLLNWGQRRINLDFSSGIGGALKGWLRNQIDEEQFFELPAHRLVPGARIRLQIRHGFSDEVTTLDVTLPPDFKSEKPIRLKGMGKKLGHWQGDLYLRFSAKS